MNEQKKNIHRIRTFKHGANKVIVINLNGFEDRAGEIQFLKSQ